MKKVQELSREEAAEELAELARKIAQADNAYYQNDEPDLTDADYDVLKHRNAEIEARFPEETRNASFGSPNTRMLSSSVQSGWGMIPTR